LIVMLNADNRWSNAKKALDEAMKSKKTPDKKSKIASKNRLPHKKYS